ncbi:hypothetical protein J4H92_14290 [Leucobacter weissii]|uniref:DUF4232 domain-containing protein n=1 Tax=Leucobacter weissii TaxID=1983706 RepID=A0A939MMT8_9MICO|nr:hypothetical protein [Leucobacter weissii]MBO1903110.1 hypothetical protein [Leucobacter weissii]
MSGWKDPVGPKSRGVYIRRRILVLLGLLAVVAAIVLIIVKPGSTGVPAAGEDVAVPEDLVASEQAEDAEKSGEEPAACISGQLRVTPSTDRESYAEGELPELSLAVENTGERACSADLGTASMTFEITSGSDEVWRSTDCQKNPDQRMVILEAGQKLTTEPISWDRTRSGSETCDVDRDPVPADGASYHLRVAIGDVDGDGTAQFLLY